MKHCPKCQRVALDNTVIYAGLNDKDLAFVWLEKAYMDRSGFLPIHLKTDAHLDSLRSDPRYKDLLKRMICLSDFEEAQ